MQNKVKEDTLFQTPMNTLGMGGVSFDNVIFNTSTRPLVPLRTYVRNFLKRRISKNNNENIK